MADDLVNGGAHALGEGLVVERGRVGPPLERFLVHDRVNLIRGHTGAHGLAGHVEHFPGNTACLAHARDLLGRLHLNVPGQHGPLVARDTCLGIVGTHSVGGHGAPRRQLELALGARVVGLCRARRPRSRGLLAGLGLLGRRAKALAAHHGDRATSSGSARRRPNHERGGAREAGRHHCQRQRRRSPCPGCSARVAWTSPPPLPCSGRHRRG
mmetsp:Transcript_17014/g.45911  ORF Transcript_17014/g.45911 Transcript_17014/m.45911 type:complete len:212 (-) Transcript_17014:29-664(-)